MLMSAAPNHVCGSVQENECRCRKCSCLELLTIAVTPARHLRGWRRFAIICLSLDNSSKTSGGGVNIKLAPALDPKGEL